MDVSTPPSLDLACPQAEADIEKYVHMFRDRGVDKIKYGHDAFAEDVAAVRRDVPEAVFEASWRIGAAHAEQHN